MTKNTDLQNEKKNLYFIFPKHWGGSQPERLAGVVACIYSCWKIYPLEEKRAEK